MPFLIPIIAVIGAVGGGAVGGAAVGVSVGSAVAVGTVGLTVGSTLATAISVGATIGSILPAALSVGLGVAGAAGAFTPGYPQAPTSTSPAVLAARNMAIDRAIASSEGSGRYLSPAASVSGAPRVGVPKLTSIGDPTMAFAS